MSAGEALTATGIDLDSVRRRLPRIEPYAVRIRRAPRWFQALWARGITAVAMPWGIYFSGATYDRLVSGSEPHRDGPLVVHELTHIEQFRRLGAVRHLVGYSADYLRGRRRGRAHWDAYREIALEVEAREVAAEITTGGGPR